MQLLLELRVVVVLVLGVVVEITVVGIVDLFLLALGAVVGSLLLLALGAFLLSISKADVWYWRCCCWQWEQFLLVILGSEIGNGCLVVDVGAVVVW